MCIPIRPYRFFTILPQLKKVAPHKRLDALYKHSYKSQCHEHLMRAFHSQVSHMM